jgi:hypothetical protein
MGKVLWQVPTIVIVSMAIIFLGKQMEQKRTP